jgi:DNA-binding CsgD family transcriptional regulator
MVDAMSHPAVLAFPGSRDDRDGIIGVIDGETAAWIRGDFEEWKTFWVQRAHARHVTACGQSSRVLQGFDDIQGFYMQLFRQFSEGGRTHPEGKRVNMRFNIGADMAWATFDQIMPVDNTALESGLFSEMRILEKVDGQWKIAASFVMPCYYGYYTSPWVRVDGMCRIIDKSPGLDEALNGRAPFLIIGNRLCGHRPEDTRRLRDDVAEADVHVRNRDIGSPTPLLLSDRDGGPAPPCWITIADMTIIVLLHDQQLLSNAVSRAGRMFGLTTAQVRVAEAIAHGHDLSVIANTLQVRPNTVRTHVRRMFERLNVNSQTALVRTMLSAGPPH